MPFTRVALVVKVGVVGARGAMGAVACDAVRSADGLELVAEVGRGDSLDLLAACEIAIDLTHPGVVMDTLAWCIDHEIHAVVGTSGFTEHRLDVVRDRLRAHRSVGVLVVPNFSIGAVLMMRFAAEAAPFFESVEIVETHHPDKRDAPSGTALRTAQFISTSRADRGVGASPDATETDNLGARGGRVAGVSVHSVRVRGAVAHQEVVLGNPGEILTIGHDMLDRAATRQGIIASVRAVATMPGLTVGLERVIGLD